MTPGTWSCCCHESCAQGVTGARRGAWRQEDVPCVLPWVCGRVPKGLRPMSPSRAAPARLRPLAMIPVGVMVSPCTKLWGFCRSPSMHLGEQGCPCNPNPYQWHCSAFTSSAPKSRGLCCRETPGAQVPGVPELSPSHPGHVWGSSAGFPAGHGAVVLDVVSPNTAVMGEAVGAVKKHNFGVNSPAVSRADAVSKPWHFCGSRSTFANKARGYRRVRMNSS